MNAAVPDAFAPVRVRVGLGFGLAAAAQLLEAECATTYTAGGRLYLARQVTLTVLGKAADLHPQMSVSELLTRLETGGMR